MIDIYGTLGPACADRKILGEMLSLGMTGMRLNLSHMTLPEAAPMIRLLQDAAGDAGVRPQLLIDMQGPELRTGVLPEPVGLEEGATVCLSCTRTPAQILSGSRSTVQKMLQIPVPDSVLSALTPGQEMLLDDGKLLLKVTEISCRGNDLPASCLDDGERPPVSSAAAEVLRGGTLRSRKSIALPGVRVDSPAMTETDRENLRFAKEYGVTAVMQPFVRSPEDLKTVRAALNAAGCGDIRLFAKIENTDGIRMIESLIPEADEIVIARGDLGNAVPLWDLPGVQKTIAARCRAAGKAFMVVTQMLASMEQNPVPTRAEVSDIFNAVLDGAASVMVTGETAAGKYPVEVIRCLVNTVRSAEKYLAEQYPAKNAGQRHAGGTDL